MKTKTSVILSLALFFLLGTSVLLQAQNAKSKIQKMIANDHGIHCVFTRSQSWALPRRR